ncbi:Bug family tripartite tricarboxylate transporter substrate binding protein [Caenimonas aquaedulcis]|uniref:Tripartite tricarboxylate transporter substrate binding protein n=1 Tax=Caenimonas aquaedulcis TaxID=2793270 RepID=A0A931MG82_9BURK|nr:tripartite tricarboxylate transporter substrate binding protein [Caenimonas aquaedulcis]MBG9387976.1 tripartite tricarboxylate transporter substrate binding protein [Caenimonas aquaedulcis]
MTLRFNRRSFNLAAASLAATSLASRALAQSGAYPSKTIRIVVPFPAGGGTDAAGRQMAQRIGDRLKATAIVENRPGAGGGLGTLTVARSDPDGYTLVVGGVGTLFTAKALFPELKLDPMKELTPVALLTSTPLALVVPANSPFTSVAQLVEAARTRKDGLFFGSGGAGPSQLAVEMFADMGKLQLQHVPYKGSAPALQDLAAGRIDFMMDILSSVSSLIKAGRLRLLAVSTPRRVPQYPDVPTVAETPGFAGFEALTWTGLFAPRATDPKIIQQLSSALNDKTDEAAFKAQVEASGAYFTPMTAPQFDAFVKSEHKRWGPVIEKAVK